MIVVRFKMQAKAEKATLLRRALEAVVRPSRKVTGVQSFDIAQDLTDANVFIATEVFEDRGVRRRLVRAVGVGVMDTWYHDEGSGGRMTVSSLRRRPRPGSFPLAFAAGCFTLIGCESNVAQTPASSPITAAEVSRVLSNSGSATCPLGSYVVGGGCLDNGTCTTPRVKASYPTSTTTWSCSMGCNDPGTGGNGVPATFVMCLRTVPASSLSAVDR